MGRAPLRSTSTDGVSPGSRVGSWVHACTVAVGELKVKVTEVPASGACALMRQEQEHFKGVRKLGGGVTPTESGSRSLMARLEQLQGALRHACGALVQAQFIFPTALDALLTWHSTPSVAPPAAWT